MTDALPLVHSGKVRDIYAVGDDQLLMVTSDRLSAFDVMIAEPIPHKGRVLTAMSAYWFEVLGDVVGSHLFSTDAGALPAEAQAVRPRPGRADHALPARPRCCRSSASCGATSPGRPGRSTRRSGTMHGQDLPAGLQESDQLPEPVFTPSTKADDGHDENISYEAAVDLVGAELATKARDVSLELYRRGAELARERGIIIADTKFELGLVDGELVLCDEVMTPDSSRFWPVDEWKPGATPPSFDKQPLRDYLEDARLGQDPAAATAARRGRRHHPAAATSRPTSASPAGSFAAWPGVS